MSDFQGTDEFGWPLDSVTSLHLLRHGTIPTRIRLEGQLREGLPPKFAAVADKSQDLPPTVEDKPK